MQALATPLASALFFFLSLFFFTHNSVFSGGALKIQLGAVCGGVEELVVDTNHFKGNFPESCKV